jgi:hypothetical protein
MEPEGLILLSIMAFLIIKINYHCTVNVAWVGYNSCSFWALIWMSQTRMRVGMQWQFSGIWLMVSTNRSLAFWQDFGRYEDYLKSAISYSPLSLQLNHMQFESNRSILHFRVISLPLKTEITDIPKSPFLLVQSNPLVTYSGYYDVCWPLFTASYATPDNL